MKTNGTYHKPYSAREVIEILQKAKELGVLTLRLDGFEADFEPWQLEAPLGRGSEPRSEERPWQSVSPVCDDCGNEKIRGRRGDWYCRPCWAAKKRDGE